MNLISVLKESIILIRQQPKVFIPKLITTALYSFYALWATRLMLKVYSLSSAIPTEEVSSLLSETLLLFLFVIILYFVDLISYAMYPSIVSAYRKQKPVKLTTALMDALSVWNVILLLGVLILVFLFAVLLVVGLTQFIALEFSMPILVGIAISLVLLLVMLFSILVFFVIPVAVVEKKGLLSSFHESISLGFKHKNELFKVNIMFLVLASVTLLIGMVSEFKGFVAFMAIAVFVLIRLIQAVVYTYMCVVNPYLYLRIKEQA